MTDITNIKPASTTTRHHDLSDSLLMFTLQ